MKILVEQTYLECQEGTSNKFYHIVVITNKDSNRATLIKRYGPIGKFGSLTIKSSLTNGEAMSSAGKTVREKERKGYRVERAPMTFSSAHEMGRDSLQDKEFISSFGKLLDKSQIEAMRSQDGWNDGQILKYPTAASPTAAKQVEEERASAYADSWGAW